MLEFYFFSVVDITKGLFPIVNELILIISKLSKQVFFEKQNAQKYVFQTTCRTEQTLESKDAKNHENNKKKVLCCFN